jgi:hypothetical protein
MDVRKSAHAAAALALEDSTDSIFFNILSYATKLLACRIRCCKNA